MQAEPDSSLRSVDGDGSFVEQHAHLARQVVRAERLLQERNPRLEDAVVADRRVGVTGGVEDLVPGRIDVTAWATSGPLIPGITTSVSEQVERA